MPSIKFDHQACRERVCLLCLKKASKVQSFINDTWKELIERTALPSFRQYCEFPSLPVVICSTCRVRLRRREEKGDEIAITVPKLSKFLDFEVSEEALSKTDCTCIVCQVGHARAKQRVDVSGYTEVHGGVERPTVSITDPDMRSSLRSERVKEMRKIFKKWCCELECELDQLNGLLLYLNNICAKCQEQDLAGRDNVCTEGSSTEIAKFGWGITDSKLCLEEIRQRIQELRATFEEWCAKLRCRPDQLSGLFLYLDNIHTKKHKTVSKVGWNLFKEEPLQITEREKDRFKERKKCKRRKDESKHICTLCGEMLISKRKLICHERQHAGTIDTCDICGQQFALFNALVNHKVQAHKKKLSERDASELHCCDQCGKQYGSRSSLDSHTRNAHGEPIKCEHCEFITPNQQLLARHVTRHEDPSFKCSICGKMFRDR